MQHGVLVRIDAGAIHMSRFPCGSGRYVASGNERGRKVVHVITGSCEEIVSRANSGIAKLANVGRLRM